MNRAISDRGVPWIVALDLADPEAADAMAARLDPSLCRLKVGKELFLNGGPALVERLINRGYEVFLDLKFHDIPNTVAGACMAAARLGVWMINCHALGGRRMLEAATASVADLPDRPLLVAVTILTSMEERDLEEVGIVGPLDMRVHALADLAHDAGFDGVVCSAHEAARLRGVYGPEFGLVTPGIRPAASADDQRRVMTPAAALAAGADYLVIGRPVIMADDPMGVLLTMEREIGHGI